MSATEGPTIQADTVINEAIGQTLGRYNKLVEKIGEEGFGVV